MRSPNQARPGKSTPAAVTMKSGFKTNVPMTTCKCTPSSRLQPKLYPVHAALSGNGVN